MLSCLLIGYALSSATHPVAQPQITIIDAVLGKGPIAAKGDWITIDYRGSLQNGTVFDDTKGKAPFVFKLDGTQVIKGMDQGVLGAHQGGKRYISIPPDLGYGEKGVGPIPGNAVLIFEIEVLRVEKENSKIEITFEDTSAGSGEPAKEGDEIEVHYTGKFLNGTKFDSSLDRGEPLKVEIGKTGLIKGFTQGLLGMKLGGKRVVTIPYQLAYGEQGRPPKIPGRSTLVFELELVSHKPKP